MPCPSLAACRALSSCGRGGSCAVVAGPDGVEVGLEVISRKLSSEDIKELAGLRAIMPNWIAEPTSALVADDLRAPSMSRAGRT